MTSRHLVDPDFKAMLDLLQSFALTREDLPQIRANLLATMAAAAPPPDDSVVMTEHVVPARSGTPEGRAFVYRPADATGALPAFLHLHGGGFIMGAPFIRDTRSRYLAKAIGCTVVSVRYRLAPENPFPAGLEDAYSALVWLHAKGAGIAIDSMRIAIGGESAGGGLAAALAQMARDRGEVSILLQALTYPMLDNRTGWTEDRGAHSGEFMWNATSNRFGWKALLGEDHPVEDPRPYAVPGQCRDVAGLPPAFIAVGTLDLFAEENLDYAKRLIHAGVPTELHVYPGAFHGFDSVPKAWSAESFLSHQVAALKRAFNST